MFFRRFFRSCSASNPPHWGTKTVKRDLRQSFFLECLKSRGGILRQKDENLNPTRWVRFLFILCYLWGIESAGRFPWKLSFRLLFSGRFVPAVFCLHRLVDLFFRFLPAPSVVCFFFDYSLVPVLFAVFFFFTFFTSAKSTNKTKSYTKKEKQQRTHNTTNNNV